MSELQGMLSIGAAALGSGYILAVDVDANALELASENIEKAACSEAVSALFCGANSSPDQNRCPLLRQSNAFSFPHHYHFTDSFVSPQA